MPYNTPVEKMYQALLKEGKSEESSARIAQAKTGLSLKTGKPAKHENAFSKSQINMVIAEFAKINRSLTESEIQRARSICMRAQPEDLKAIADSGAKHISDIARSVMAQKSSFQNNSISEARKKADAIYKEMQKSPEAYERLKGAHEKAKKEQERLIDISFKSNSFQNGRTRALNRIMNRAEKMGVKLDNTGFGSNYESREYMQGWKDGKGDEVRFQQSPYPSGIKKKDWERGWQDGYKAKHGKPNTSRMG